MQAMLLAIVGLALAGKYYSWRVRLDAHLFAILAGAPERATSLDALLAWCLHLSPTTASRPLASKWRGARRLLIRQALVLALQVLVVVASAVIAGWGNS